MYKKVDLYFKILKLSNNCGFAVTLVCHVKPYRGRCIKLVKGCSKKFKDSHTTTAPFMVVVYSWLSQNQEIEASLTSKSKKMTLKIASKYILQNPPVLMVVFLQGTFRNGKVLSTVGPFFVCSTI